MSTGAAARGVTPDRRAHVRPLTTLRFLAALWVLLHHALPRGTPGGFTERLGATGWLGVSLFFVLSGFLLTVRYAPQGELRGTRRAFWLERVARLAPTYLLALAFALPLFVRDARVGGLPPEAVGRTAAAVLTLQQSWRPALACRWDCPAWSLSVEAWFYLAFPALIAVLGAWMHRGDPRTRGGVIVAAGLAASAAMFPHLERATAGWWLPVYPLSPLARWPEFVVGIGLAGAVGGWAPRSRAAGFALLAVAATWLSLCAVAQPAVERLGGHLLPVALPGFVLAVAGAWALRAHGAGLLDWAAPVLLGEASYALYLFHAPLHGYVLALTSRLVGPGHDTAWWLFAGYVVAATALAVAVHTGFELPWRSRLRARFARAATPPPPAGLYSG